MVYRVGLVGCSGIAIARPERSVSSLRSPLPHSHAAAFHATPSTMIVAICDLSAKAMTQYDTLWGATAHYSDYREMLAKEQLDLLSIVTPDHLHADLLVAACAAGVRGIFCEKPIATTLDDADRMLAAAEQSGTKVVVNHTRRFDPFYRQAKWLIDQGTIGPVRRIVGTMAGERAMLFRNGTHLIDTMSYFAAAEPAWVTAEFDQADAKYGAEYHGDGGRNPATDPGMSALLEFTNGIRAFYNGSKGTATNFEVDLQGELGRIRIGNQLAELSTVVIGGGLATQPLPLSVDLRSGMVIAVEELIALVENNGDGTAAIKAARLTLATILGMLSSAAAGGQKVRFPQANLAKSRSE